MKAKTIIKKIIALEIILHAFVLFFFFGQDEEYQKGMMLFLCEIVVHGAFMCICLFVWCLGTIFNGDDE